MQSANIILSFTIILQATLFSKFLFQIIRQKSVSNILICLISIVLLLHLVDIYVNRFSDFKISLHVSPIAIASYGPLAYCYILALSARRTVSQWTLFISFLPLLLIIAIHIVGSYNYSSWLHTLFHIVIYIYSLAFLFLSLSVAYRNLIHGKHEWSWTYHFLILLTCLILLIALDYIRFITSWGSLQIFTINGVIWIGFIIGVGLFLQNQLYPSIFIKTNCLNSKARRSKQKLYSASKELQMAQELRAYMLEFRPHLRHDLTINKLSEQVNIPVYVLSNLINTHFKKSFLQFINSYRIERAKQLLNHSNLKVLAVALESGFSNKTTFNRAFKKFTGMAPSKFRNKRL